MLKQSFLLLLCMPLCILLLDIVFAGIQLNEIMANPSCSESYCEYIELFNNGTSSVNMTGWEMSDSADEDGLESYDGEDIIIPGESFALIVDTDTRVYSNFEVGNVTWIYVEDSALGGSGLSNSGENVSLKDSGGDVIDSFSFSSTTDGMSYSLINGNWVETSVSPGKDNIENVSFSNDYSGVSVSEFLPDPEGEDDANMPGGEWVELYNSGNEDLDLLGFSLYDNVGSSADVVVTNTSTNGDTVIKSEDYLVVYMNGVSGFLNNKGYDKIKLYDLNDELIDSVSYEGSDEGVSWSLSEGRWEKSSPTLGSGNMDNSSSVQSEIRIEEVYDLGDGKAEWGDVVRVKFFVYRGNTGKKTVWVWIEDSEEERVTKKSKFSVFEKFQNYTFTYPIFIPENCDDGFVSGRGKIIVEGLDEEDEEILEIREKPLCKDGKKKARVKDFEYGLVEFSNAVHGNSLKPKIKLKSNKEDLKVDVSGYVYSGKKKYSNEQAKVIELKQGKEEIVELDLEVEDFSKASSPRLKVKILKEGRKTPYDITKEIKLGGGKSETVKKGLGGITGSVVYEGKSVEAGRMGVWFFSGLMMSLGVYGFFRRWKKWK
jgi:hypothetical protein